MEKVSSMLYGAHLLSVSLEIICPKIRIHSLKEHPAGYVVQASLDHSFSEELIDPLETCMQQLHQEGVQILLMVPESAAGYLQKQGLNRLAKEAQNSKKQVLHVLKIGPKIHLEEQSVTDESSHFVILEALLTEKKHEKIQHWEFLVRSCSSEKEKKEWKRQYLQRKQQSFLAQAEKRGWLQQVDGISLWHEPGIRAKRLIEETIKKSFSQKGFEEILMEKSFLDSFKKKIAKLNHNAFFIPFTHTNIPFDQQYFFFKKFLKQDFEEIANSFLHLWKEIFKIIGIDISVTLSGRKTPLWVELCRENEKSGISSHLDETKASSPKITFYAKDIWERDLPIVKGCFDLRSDHPLLWGELFSIERILALQVESEAN